ncbi:hypothetical protein [Streptomyces sp. NPDC059262]|uniref:hypothetical protein n=1 Tax=Streptomyces sp. NPDC059262 TaxID=3346797 RepID=UPI00368EF453
MLAFSHRFDGLRPVLRSGPWRRETVRDARRSCFSAYSYCAQALKDRRVDAMVTRESILIDLE